MVDAVLLVSFGGPEAPEEVMPFLRRVTAGRGIPDGRLAEVAEHYLAFGGVSPLNEQNRRLRDALAGALADAGIDLPVYLGNRNSPPFFADAISAAVADGARHLLAVVTAAYASYSGCRQYREELAEAIAGIENAGGRAPRIDKVRLYFDHPGFLAPFVAGTAAAWRSVPPDRQQSTRILFSTHSIPVAADAASGPGGGAYTAQHRAAMAAVLAAVTGQVGAEPNGELVFQSRSGDPRVPWLEPDVNDRIVALAAEGVTDVVVVPIGFLSDHLEVRYDLDTEAAATAQRCGVGFQRVATPGTDPEFVAGLVALIAERVADGPRAALSDLGPAPDRCPAGCCRNPRQLRPAIAEGPA